MNANISRYAELEKKFEILQMIKDFKERMHFILRN